MCKNGEVPVMSSCDGNELSDPVPPGDNVVKYIIKLRFMHGSPRHSISPLQTDTRVRTQKPSDY
jgi:hypothetical protein